MINYPRRKGMCQDDREGTERHLMKSLNHVTMWVFSEHRKWSIGMPMSDLSSTDRKSLYTNACMYIGIDDFFDKGEMTDRSVTRAQRCVSGEIWMQHQRDTTKTVSHGWNERDRRRDYSACARTPHTYAHTRTRTNTHTFHKQARTNTRQKITNDIKTASPGQIKGKLSEAFCTIARVLINIHIAESS